MAKRKKKKDLTLDQVRELFRYENGKLYWKTTHRCFSKPFNQIAGTRGRIIPRVIIQNKICYLHKIVYLLHHGFYPQRLDFKDKTLTPDGMYDISIENLFEPPKKVVVKKPKRKFRKEVSYFEANDYLEYKNGRLYWKAKPYPNSCVVVGNLVGGISARPVLKVKLHGINYLQHRIVYLLHHKYCPDVVTFINKTLTDEGFYDISIENLKASTYGHEISIGHRQKKNKTSKYKGVYLDKDAKKYRVVVTANGVTKNGGGFKNEEEAARRYDELARHLIGEDAVLNFPEEKPLSTSIS